LVVVLVVGGGVVVLCWFERKRSLSPPRRPKNISFITP